MAHKYDLTPIGTIAQYVFLVFSTTMVNQFALLSEWFMGVGYTFLFLGIYKRLDQVAALNGYEHANSTALNLWEEIYGDNRWALIALTDTFSTECFLRVIINELI